MFATRPLIVVQFVSPDRGFGNLKSTSEQRSHNGIIVRSPVTLETGLGKKWGESGFHRGDRDSTLGLRMAQWYFSPANQNLGSPLKTFPAHFPFKTQSQLTTDDYVAVFQY